MVNLHRYLNTYDAAGPFNSLIAPHRFINNHVFLTKANALGIVRQHRGLDPECLTDETLESHTTRIANVSKGYDDRFRLYQYVIKQDGARLEQRSDHRNPVVSSTVEARRNFLESKPEGLYSIQLFDVDLLESPPPAALQRILSTKDAVRVLISDLERNYEALMAQARSFHRDLKDLLYTRTLDKGEAFHFLRILANLDQEIARGEGLKRDTHIDVQLPSFPIACTHDGLQLGPYHLEILSLKTPPTSTYPNMLKDLIALPANFILCSEFKRLTDEKAMAVIRSAQRHFFWSQYIPDVPTMLHLFLNRGKKENVIPDKTALEDVNDLDLTLSRVKSGEYMGEYSFTVVLWGEDRQKLHATVKDITNIFGQIEASLIHERFNAFNAFLSIFPGNTAFNLRKTYLLRDNYKDLAFRYAPYTGEQINAHHGREHLVVLETNDRTPFYFNLHVGKLQGTLIFGQPDSGKSVLTNLLIDHAQKDAPWTFVLDIKSSYREITRKHGGSYVEIRFGDGIQTFRINPFVLDNTPDNRQFLSTFITLLLETNGYGPSAKEANDLFEAIESMYVLDRKDRTLSNLVAGLPPRMAAAMHCWVGNGQYGSVFDNVEDTLTFSRFQAFDFLGMGDYPKVLNPLLLYIFHRFSQIVHDPRYASELKQLWADELSQLLPNDTAREYLLTAGKTWRKDNGGITLITQSAGDFERAGILDLISEVCLVKILLANPEANHAFYRSKFHLTEAEVERFQALIPKQQALWKTAARSKVLNVHLDPVAYWHYTNSPYDNERRQAAFESHGIEEGYKRLAAAI